MQQVQLRESFQSQRDQVRERFRADGDGLAAVRAMTQAVEEVLLALWSRNLARLGEDDRTKIESSVSVAAIGGFGRREQCPYSDVDLLVLQEDKPPQEVGHFVGEFVRDIWDTGLSLGQNVGSAKQLVALAAKEVLPATSLLDARPLFGSEALHRKMQFRFSKFLRGGAGPSLFLKAIEAVREDQKKFGSTVHLLEPNVKRSKGGLRDIHLVRWAAASLHPGSTVGELEELGVLGLGDAQALEDALRFLLRVRCDLHFHSSKSHDDLLRADQWRMAEAWGYLASEARLAVECFMADYFRHSTAVADIVERLIERTRPRTLMAGARDMLLSRRAGDGVLVGSDRLILSVKRRSGIGENLQDVLELADLAARSGVHFSYSLTESLRRYHLLHQQADDAPERLTEEESRAFLRFLGRSGPLGTLLRVLHRVGILTRIIPEFEHTRCLLQFNAYHKYTVDEHTFVVIDNIQGFAHRNDVIGRAYAKVKRKDLLHLAILLHDIGKGFAEDHSELGRKIALRVAHRLHLTDEERDIVVFLVHKHLFLSDLAMKRDISDPKLWIHVAKQVGDAPVLRMLYTLTCADIMGVGPGVFSAWTSELLEEVYCNTLTVLGEEDDARSTTDRCDARRTELLAKHGDDPEKARVLESLPIGYLAFVALDEIEEHLDVASRLQSGSVEILSKFRPETKTTTYTIFTTEQTSKNVFSKICGGLAAHHLGVLRAQIYTLADGSVIDQFDVQDTHYFGDPTPERVKKVIGTIRRILLGDLSVQDALYSSRSSLFLAGANVQAPVNTNVSVDNVTSETCSVIDVFTNNRRGLLYTLAQSLARCGLSVQYAKIATYEDEAADVFYVRDENGSKILDSERIRQIEEVVIADVHRLAHHPREMGF